MKIPSFVIGLVAVAFGMMLAFAPRLFADDKKCKIVVQARRIVIPLINLSNADATELNGILHKYDKSLYKIVKVENGQLVGKPDGSLEDKYICEKATIVQALQDSGEDGEAIQIGGFGCTPACPTRTENDNLVAEAEELLKKYCP
jgi:hypothetical protein